MGTAAARRLALVLMIAAVVLAACGDGGGNAGGGTTAVRAGAATTAAGSFRIAFETRSFDPADPRRTLSRSSGEGVVDLAHDRSRFTSTGSASQEEGVDGDEPPTFEVITIGHDAWLKPGFVASGSSLEDHLGIDAKPWVHEDRPGTSTAAATGGADPVSMLAALREEGADLRPLGHEKVRGVQTGRYAVKSARGGRLDRPRHRTPRRRGP